MPVINQYGVMDIDKLLISTYYFAFRFKICYVAGWYFKEAITPYTFNEVFKIYKGFYGNDKLLIENEEEPCYNELNFMKNAEIHPLELESVSIEHIEGEKLQKNYENLPKIEILSVGRLH